MLRRFFTIINQLRAAYSFWVIVAPFLISAAAAAWLYLQQAPWLIIILSALGALFVVLLIAVVFAIYIYGSPEKGIYSPRLLRQYSWPSRKIAWSFDNYLGGSGGGGKPIRVSGFQGRFKITWGEGISPKAAYLECKRTATRQDVLIECGNPYVRANEIGFMPKGKWYHAMAFLGHPGLTKEEFLRRWDGFEFVFEFDSSVFRRKFPRFEIEQYFDRYWACANPPPEPTPTRRDVTP
ncbi:MAG TPA: hypothetical protein VHA10_03715 [Hypericibacter adhaerens]|jgi:hypothetical protein|uniref:hypothetical protein n=1 Tax=Hypericibacter adhaerens TaxID=2602016 RepID=UPI0012443C1D|nr:hypothetical protein [Hypericibacter adhaerens]HWA42292.1 hypothetical protein [Hypericibacter adhaerens]